MSTPVSTPTAGTESTLRPVTGSDQFTAPEKTEQKHPQLGSTLGDLIAKVEAGEVTLEEAAQEAPLYRGESVAVTFYLSGNVAGVVAFLKDKGVSPRNVGEDYIEAYVPLLLLPEASVQSGVLSVRVIQPPESLQKVTGHGPSVHASEEWNVAGFGGAGIRVGIIDDGFVGFSGLMGDELPSTVEARCYPQDSDSPTGEISDCEWDSDHGTAVSEAVLDISPDVSLYIANVDSNGDVHSAVTWMIEQDVDVVNHSMGWLFDGPGDGESPDSSSPLNALDRAVDEGIVWVNAAGNERQNTWFGAPSDSDNDGVIEFAANDEGINFVLSPGDLTIQLRWDDNWSGAVRDLDLYIYTADTNRKLLMSEDEQSGRNGDKPFEWIPTRGWGSFYIVVVNRSESLPSWIQLTLWGNVSMEYYTDNGSIGNPAESANTGMLAVGATPWDDINTIEDFSSRGPAPDGRIKPDVVAADCGESRTYPEQDYRPGCWFPGTSQAAPHVAGLAALVRQRFSDLTPAQVVFYLKDHAEQRIGSPDPNNIWGHGFVMLPSPTELLGSPTIQSISPDDGSLDVEWVTPEQIGSSAIVAYDLRHIPSSAQSKADSDWTVVQDAWSVSGSLQYMITGLTGGVQYDVQVRAVNTAGDGPWSATLTGTTAEAAPAAPTALTATANGQTQIDLSWTAPSSDGGTAITGYWIEVSTDSSNWSDLESNTRLNATSYSHSGLSAGSTRFYRVSAINSAGTSQVSNLDSATTGAAPAPDLVVDRPTVSESAPVAGASFTLNATVRNQGSGASVSTTLRYFRSTDSTISTRDTEVGTDTVFRIGASGSGDESISQTAPSTPGTYYYGACVDAVSDETDATNNCSDAVTVTVGAAPAPDLVVDRPTVSESAPVAGGSFTLNATVRNQGNGASVSTTLRYYQSTDSTISTRDTEVGTDSVFRIGASGSGDESISQTAPSTPGTYYYGACVDAVSDETDATNNCSAGVTVTVGATPGPDLIVDTPTVSESAPVAGASFSLNATVRNQGNGASVSTTLRYFRSIDSTISTGDTEVGTDQVSALSASGSGAESISQTAPSTAGTYYYGACVDTVSDETDATNNCSAGVTVTVGAAPAPDLVVDRPTVSESAPVAGGSFTLNATVRNQGSGASVSTTLRYYQSTDSTISTGDTEVGTDQVSALSASGSGSESISQTAPSTPGTHYYGACVDEVSDEADTNNNCSLAVTVNVGAAPAPDLVVDRPTVSESAPVAGGSFTLNATVRNQGSGASVSTTLRYYRSTDSTISTGDTEVGTDRVSALSASGSEAESISQTAPSTAGTYYYGACVDAVSDETDAANNCSAVVTVTVGATPVPDLMVDTPTVVTSAPAAGASFTLSATVRNQGSGASVSTTLRYYRSTDSTITTSDTEVGTDQVSALSASGSGDESISQTAPSTPGTYYYGACVDAVSDETDATNNCSGAVTVTVGAALGHPTNQSYSRQGSTTIVSWNAVAGADHYNIYHDDFLSSSCRLSSGNPSFCEELATNVVGTSYTHTTPDDDENYYWVTACNSGGCSEIDSDNPATFIDTRPSSPANQSYSRQGSTTVVSWNAVAGADHYNIYHDNFFSSSCRLSSGNPSFCEELATNVVGTSYTHTTPDDDENYYWVTACNSGGCSEIDSDNPALLEDAAPAPDLVVDTPTVSESAPTAGASFTLSATVRNQGSGASVSTTLRYYRSTDSTISTGDTEVGTDQVSALSASGSGAESISQTAPSTAGTYYFGACVDAVSDESDANNNCSGAVTVSVGAAPAPDLVVDRPTVSESAPAAGASFTLSATVRNQGSGASVSTTLRYYQSADSTITTSDTEVGTDSVSRLAASESGDESISLSAPADQGTYYYGACVEALSDESDNVNNCSPAVAVTVGAVTSVPGAPAGLTATGNGETQIDLSWTAPSNDGGAAITGYKIEVSTDGSSWSDLESDTQSTTTTYSHSGLTAGSTRHYRVSAINSAGTGPASNSANATTSLATEGSPDLVADNTLLSANVTPGYNLSLNATVRNQGDGPSDSTTLRYYRSTDATITTNDIEVGTDPVDRLIPSSSIRHAIGVKVPSTPGTYYYGACVDAVGGESDAGNNCSTATEVTVRVVNSPPQVVGDLDDMTVTLGEGFRVDISGVFSEPDGEEIQNYGFTLRTKGILTGSVHIQTGILNLRAIGIGATTVAVEASDIHGNGSGPHDLFVVTVVPAKTTTAPGAPTGLTATANGQTQIGLSWTAPSDDGGAGITGYKIEVSTNGTSWSDLVSDTDSTVTSYSHTGLTAGATRHYRASAINSAGTGPPSKSDSATTEAATAPDAPTGLTVTADGQTQIDLSWTAPSDDGGADISGYKIEVSTNGTSWSDLVSDTDSTGTSYSHTGLTAGSTRHYRVSAINPAGSGLASNTDSATTDAATAPDAPTGLTVTADGQTQIDLSWTAPSDDGGADISGYKIEVSTNGTSWSDLVSDTDSTGTSYSHSGLTAGSTRHYRVSAINSAGTGLASNTDSATTAEEPVADATCTVDLIVAPGEICTYPGTSTEFSVHSNGTGHFLFASSASGIQLRNTTINGVAYTFVASKQSDGNWIVEEVG